MKHLDTYVIVFGFHDLYVFSVSPVGPRKYSRKESLPNTCKYCSFTCKSVWSLSSHLSTKHDIKNSFSCLENDCDFSTSSKYFLDKHALSVHGNSIVEKSKQTKSGKTVKAKAAKTALKKKNAVNSKEKQIYRPTMVSDVDTIDRDVEIIESLLTDSDEEGITATDDKDIDWGKYVCGSESC